MEVEGMGAEKEEGGVIVFRESILVIQLSALTKTGEPEQPRLCRNTLTSFDVRSRS